MHEDTGAVPRSNRREFLNTAAGAFSLLAMRPAAARSMPAAAGHIFHHVVASEPDHSSHEAVRPGWVSWSPESAAAALRDGGEMGYLSFSTPFTDTSDKARHRSTVSRMNAHAVDVASRYPGHLRAFASLPALDDVKGCLAEFERALSRGVDVVSVMATCGSRRLSDERFAPVWAALDEAGASVFVQPALPALGPAMPVFEGSLTSIQGNPVRAVKELRAERELRNIRFLATAEEAGNGIGISLTAHCYWWGHLPKSRPVVAFSVGEATVA